MQLSCSGVNARLQIQGFGWLADLKLRVNDFVFMQFYGESPLVLSDPDQGYRVLNADNLDELVVTANYLAFEVGALRIDVRKNFITKEDVRKTLAHISI